MSGGLRPGTGLPIRPHKITLRHTAMAPNLLYRMPCVKAQPDSHMSSADPRCRNI